MSNTFFFESINSLDELGVGFGRLNHMHMSSGSGAQDQAAKLSTPAEKQRARAKTSAALRVMLRTVLLEALARVEGLAILRDHAAGAEKLNPKVVAAVREYLEHDWETYAGLQDSGRLISVYQRTNAVAVLL